MAHDCGNHDWNCQQDGVQAQKIRPADVEGVHSGTWSAAATAAARVALAWTRPKMFATGPPSDPQSQVAESVIHSDDRGLK